MLEIIIYTLLSVFVVSLVSLIGVATILFKRDIQKILLILVSLSAGTLFGGAFLHLLPEAVEKEGFTVEVSLLVLAGIFVFFILEKIVHWHCHIHATLPEDVKKHEREHHPHIEDRSQIAVLNLVGDGIHNFVDGLVIAGTYLISTSAGLAITLAVILHEVPQEIADFGVLLYSGLSKRKALFYNYLSAAVAFVGAIVGLYFGGRSESFIRLIIPFAAGGFIYIAGSNLIPELHKECGMKESIWHVVALVAGVLIMYGLKFLQVA